MKLQRRDKMSLYDMLNNKNKFKKGGIYYAQNSNVVEEENGFTPGSFSGSAPKPALSFSDIRDQSGYAPFQAAYGELGGSGFKGYARAGAGPDEEFVAPGQDYQEQMYEGTEIPIGSEYQEAYSQRSPEDIEGAQMPRSSGRLPSMTVNLSDLDNPEKRDILLSSDFGKQFFVDSEEPLSQQYNKYVSSFKNFVDKNKDVISEAVASIEASDNPMHEPLKQQLAKESTPEGKINRLKELATDGKIGYAHTVFEKTQELNPTTLKVPIQGFGPEGTSAGEASAVPFLVDMVFGTPAEGQVRSQSEYEDLGSKLNLPKSGEIPVRLGQRRVPGSKFYDYLVEGIKTGVDFDNKKEADRFLREYMDKEGFVPAEEADWREDVDPKERYDYRFQQPLMSYATSAQKREGDILLGQETERQLSEQEQMMQKSKEDERIRNERLRQMVQQQMNPQYRSGGMIKVNKRY
jgi:hypothetical protein